MSLQEGLQGAAEGRRVGRARPVDPLRVRHPHHSGGHPDAQDQGEGGAHAQADRAARRHQRRGVESISDAEAGIVLKRED